LLIVDPKLAMDLISQEITKTVEEFLLKSSKCHMFLVIWY